MKKHVVLISVGILNLFHGLTHIIQFIQSMFFVAYATHDHEHYEHGVGFIDSVMHNPIFALIMGIIGILTLVIGIKDYRHHKKCETHEHHHGHEHIELSLDEEFAETMKKADRLHRQIKERDKDKNGDGLIFWE